MSNPTKDTTTGTGQVPAATASAEVATTARTGQLAGKHGSTQIADVVVRKIAGLAAREVSGVRQLGGGTARAFGALRERIPGAGTSHGQGVAVEVGERQAAIDLELLAEYGAAIPDLARTVRKNVITAIERMTGLEVVEVNINVTDVALDESGEPQPAGRVE